MSKVIKALFSPVVLIMVAALVVAIGVASGHILPKAQAAENCEEQRCVLVDVSDCPSGQAIIDNECVDVCRDGEGQLVAVPQGQHANSDGFCVDDPAPQVLGESTTVSDPPASTPQVLAESTFGK